MKTAWFGEQSLKDAAMKRLREHRRLDRIVHRTYWERGKGCHLGCLTHTYHEPHEQTERLFGIPLRVAYWLEGVFEGLPQEQCAWWVVEGTDAIPVGADLSLAHHRLAEWLRSGSLLRGTHEPSRRFALPAGVDSAQAHALPAPLTRAGSRCAGVGKP